jgi:hypothetical protein
MRRWLGRPYSNSSWLSTAATLAGHGHYESCHALGFGHDGHSCHECAEGGVSGVINGAATVTFVASGAIVWPQAIVMTLGAIFGGYFGAHFAQKLPPSWIRCFVLLVGSAMTVYFFVRAYR